MGERIKVNQRKADGDEKHAPFGTGKSNTTATYDSLFSEILHLQRTIGNRAVTRLIQSGAIQPTLKVSQSDDMYEQEADRVADQVMRMAEGSLVNGHWSLARKESEPDCPECLEEEELIQTKPASGSTSQVNADIESDIQSMSGGGQPLSESTKAFFEPRFGRDFRQVRVHQDAESGNISASLGARAFTLGKDIWIGQGESTSDKRLMAHELTHVVQQNGSIPPEIQKVSLHDYNDVDPLHDPSRLSDAEIEATDEYIELVNLYGLGPVYIYTPEEILLACRLILRSIREGRSFSLYPMVDAPAFLQLARAQLGSMRGVESFENKLNWVPFSSATAVADPTLLRSEFGRWILAGEAQPSFTTGSINCWEAILFGAFRQGYITETRIREIYTRAVRNVAARTFSSVGDTVERELRAGDIYIFDPTNPDSPAPLAGDMVVFDRAANHAAISTGRVLTPPYINAGEHEILSLWTGNAGRVEKTTIEELLRGGAASPVRFWSVRW